MTNPTLTLAEAIAAVAASQPHEYIHADGRDSKGDTYRVELDGSDAIRFSVQDDDTMHECNVIPLDARFALYQMEREIVPPTKDDTELGKLCAMSRKVALVLGMIATLIQRQYPGGAEAARIAKRELESLLPAEPKEQSR